MIKVKDGDFFVTDWLRNRNFKISVKEFAERTDTIGLQAKYLHRSFGIDINPF